MVQAEDERDGRQIREPGLEPTNPPAMEASASLTATPCPSWIIKDIHRKGQATTTGLTVAA